MVGRYTALKEDSVAEAKKAEKLAQQAVRLANKGHKERYGPDPVHSSPRPLLS